MIKRAIDFLGALLGLAAFWPVILIAAAAIRFETPGPAIFSQVRVGRRAVPFKCYKLRTMIQGSEQVPTHLANASTVTPLGRVLRRCKLDEMPQLFNVLRGEMSLVGPRPCLPIQVDLITLRQQNGALDVLPGITGLAQIQGIDMSDPPRLAAVDGYYVRTLSVRSDFRILLGTLFGFGIGTDSIGQKAE
jgi:O-antigen biosynthesis protein WbqP